MLLKPVCVIPARLASSRFPRKLLAPFQGYPIIEHVRRRALLVEAFDRVVVATCDQEIYDLVRSNGGDALMTSGEHPNGTSRVAEAIENIDCSHVVLLQGDEPLILPSHLAAMVDAISTRVDCKILNAVGPIESSDECCKYRQSSVLLLEIIGSFIAFERVPRLARQVSKLSTHESFSVSLPLKENLCWSYQLSLKQLCVRLSQSSK